MNHQPLQILVHKSDTLVSKNKEDLVDLAYVVVDMLAGSQALPDSWVKLRYTAVGITKRVTARGLAQFKLSYRNAVRDYQVSNSTKREEPPLDTRDYTERQLAFEYRVANPSYFLKDTLVAPPKVVETEADKTIIEEDSSFYQRREDEFQHRLRDPVRFRRGD